MQVGIFDFTTRRIEGVPETEAYPSHVLSSYSGYPKRCDLGPDTGRFTHLADCLFGRHDPGKLIKGGVAMRHD